MRSWKALARASTALGILATHPVASHAQSTAAPLIPAIQIDGRGHGHGVGMAQDGALAMGKAGANAKQILGQFYPGTAIGKASGNVRVPVLTGNNVELAFPEGGDIRGSNASLHVAPGGTAQLYRDGDGTRVRTGAAPPPSTTTSSAPPTTTTTAPANTTTTDSTLLPGPRRTRAPNSPTPTVTSTPAPATTTSTTSQSASQVPLFSGSITATPTGAGRVGVTTRGRRYRGTMDIAPVPGGLRFVNQVPVETYLRGMGEVRNPNWPAAGLEAQAIAARTYALRAMSFGGELCDTQRCQVYIGADAEYAAMDKAVAATSGQVLMYGKALASAVYSANAGGYTANREEGFGLAGDTHPYLRAAPYLTDDRDEWTITIALTDVARRLSYSGEVTSVNVVTRGPSGRATSLTLIGTKGDKTVSGLDFDAALGLRSTLFTLRGVMAATVATVKGGSMLQAPPEQAPALAGA
ncbi:MAG: stage sporulation protein, partial [Actinomycetota bacterium]